jgi:hypothetical protein
MQFVAIFVYIYMYFYVELLMFSFTNPRVCVRFFSFAFMVSLLLRLCMCLNLRTIFKRYCADEKCLHFITAQTCTCYNVLQQKRTSYLYELQR